MKKYKEADLIPSAPDLLWAMIEKSDANRETYPKRKTN